MPNVALSTWLCQRGSMWLDLGLRNGPHEPFEVFELVL
jgi:hypothetical protein